jgi:hypothetical protein
MVSLCKGAARPIEALWPPAIDKLMPEIWQAQNLEVAMFDLAMAGTGLVSLVLMGAYLRLTTRL